MGMELALLVLFTVVACSILLVSTSMLGKSNLNDRKAELTERFALDRLAEQVMDNQPYDNDNYVVYRRDNSGWTRNGAPVADPGFALDADLVITDQSEQVVLIVAWDGGIITRWEYR